MAKREVKKTYSSKFLLLFVIVSVIAAFLIGGFYLSRKSNSNFSSNWISYTSTKGKFSLKYPANWVQPTDRQFCGTDLFDRTVYLGPDSKSVLVCGSSYGGQMYVASFDNDKRAENRVDPGFTNVKTSTVIISGVAGERIEATYSGLTGEASGLNGYRIVRYLFYTHNTTYIASYIQGPKGRTPSQDVLKGFEQMVKTLKFTQ